jgi:hypothetical protein
VPNATHGVTRRSACARTMVAAFLDNPAAPVDRTCLAREHASLPFILEPEPQ